MGEPLCAFQRADGQVRFQLLAVDDVPKFFSIRKFQCSPNGEWLPTKEGVTIKFAEVQQVIDALQSTLTLVNDHLAQRKEKEK